MNIDLEKPDFDFILTILIKFTIVVISIIILSIERERHTHPGGVVTHLLVGLGACMYSSVSLRLFHKYDDGADPGRIAANIVSGMGFLGSATVFKANHFVKGINTAANLWIAGSIGMAVGMGFWELCIIVSCLVSGILFASNTYYKNKRQKELERRKKFDEDIKEKKQQLTRVESHDIRVLIQKEIQKSIEDENERQKDYDYIGSHHLEEDTIEQKPKHKNDKIEEENVVEQI